MAVINKPEVLLLMGPTATGKTALAVNLAQHLPIEIINVDAALVYKGMNIGTAKPDAETLQRVPHHLIDCRMPHETYNVALFIDDVYSAIQDIVNKQKIPLLVGGTQFYFNALLEGISPMPEIDMNIRKDIIARGEQEGWQTLHEELRQVDPLSAERIHPNHSQRIQRALEVFYSSDTPMSQWQNAEQFPPKKLTDNYAVKQIALTVNQRSLLHQRINQRFQLMLDQGFQTEVESLLANYPNYEEIPALKLVGYRQMIAHLNGQYSYSEMIEKANAATRQLAKRQLTWLRNWKTSIHFIAIDTEDGCLTSLETMTQQYLSC